MRSQSDALKKLHALLGGGFRIAAEQLRLRVADRNPVDRDRAFLEWFKSVDAFDEGRFSGARRAAHHHDLTFGDVGRAIFQYLNLAVPLAHMADSDHGAHRTIAMRCCSRRTQNDAASEMTK